MGDRRIKFLLVEMLLVFIFSLSFISAVPPVARIQQFADGYIVQIPQTNLLEAGEDYIFDFHVFNISNGIPIISNIGCNLHVYNSVGKHTYIGYNSTISNDFGFVFNVNGANFTYPGEYYYYIQCNSSNLGGYASSPLKIIEGGDSFELPQALILLGQLGLIALFFGMGLTFNKDKWKLKTFFFIIAMLMGIIFLNSLRIIVGTSSNLALMGNLGLILGVIVLSFMLLYMLINYTIEVFHYFKERSRMKWSVEQG